MGMGMGMLTIIKMVRSAPDMVDAISMEIGGFPVVVSEGDVL
jgi:hypothetical protein